MKHGSEHAINVHGQLLNLQTKCGLNGEHDLHAIAHNSLLASNSDEHRGARINFPVHTMTKPGDSRPTCNGRCHGTRCQSRDRLIRLALTQGCGNPLHSRHAGATVNIPNRQHASRYGRFRCLATPTRNQASSSGRRGARTVVRNPNQNSIQYSPLTRGGQSFVMQQIDGVSECRRLHQLHHIVAAYPHMRCVSVADTRVPRLKSVCHSE
jgi:hypothetical protein